MEAEEAEDLISDGAAVDARSDGRDDPRDDPRDVGPRYRGQAQWRAHLGWHAGHPLPHVPVGRIDTHRVVVTEQGAHASLRDVARRADVGLGTLYRHFPTREALLDALLRASFDELALHAARLETARPPEEALVTWLHDCVACAHEYRGVVALMMAAMEDPDSALHASCVAMRAAGTRLLARAQAEGIARADIDGADLFALAGALAWLSDQPASAPRAERLFAVIADAILTR